MLLGVKDKPKNIKTWVLYSLQQLLAVFVATVLISNICGTPTSSCLVGACLGTLVYQLITKFSSPMFISSCGATCAAVIGALSITNGTNYIPVVLGGAIIMCVYALFALVIKLKGIEAINKIFPPIIVGPVTMVIGLNLATFIPTYVQVSGEHNDIAILIAVATMIVIAITSHYFKGFWKTIPFLIGLVFGYVLSIILTITNVAPLVDFSIFNNIHIFAIPDFTWKYWDFSTVNWGMIGQVIVLFLPVAICALLEHYSDHRVLSNIIGVDLTVNPGMHRTLLGDGVASFIGTVFCGLPNTSYGESIATTGFSKVGSVYVISTAAIMLGILAFIEPFQLVIASIPSCVFGGCAMILYGYIACSGLKTLISSNVNLENNRNLVIISVILTVGVSGIFLFNASFAGVSLAMVLGVVLNLILKDKSKI